MARNALRDHLKPMRNTHGRLIATVSLNESLQLSKGERSTGEAEAFSAGGVDASNQTVVQPIPLWCDPASKSAHRC